MSPRRLTGTTRGVIVTVVVLAVGLLSGACRTAPVQRFCAPACDPSWSFTAGCQVSTASSATHQQTFVADSMRVLPGPGPGVVAVTLIQHDSPIPVTQSRCLVRLDPVAHEVLLDPQFTAGPQNDAVPTRRYLACLVQGLTPASPQQAATWRIRYDPDVVVALIPPPELPDATVVVTPDETLRYR